MNDRSNTELLRKKEIRVEHLCYFMEGIPRVIFNNKLLIIIAFPGYLRIIDKKLFDTFTKKVNCILMTS